MDSKKNMKDTKNNRREDGKFDKKHINHDPMTESSKAEYGKKELN